MEMFDWKYVITTLIALYAAWNSSKARKETKEVAEKQLAIQAKSAQYQHFPILSASIEMEDNRIRVALTNASPTNAALAYRIKFIVRIRTNKASFEEDNYTYNGGYIAPSSSIVVDPMPINELISDAIPFLKRSPSDRDNNFVVRIFLEADPSVGGNDKITLQSAARFAWETSELVLLPDPRNELG